MNAIDAASVASAKEKSGLRSALEYTGIPPSWFEKRPKLPSRNWLIFLSVTSSVVGYYVYDRRECKRIRQSYVDRVKHLADVPLGSMELPRRVTVYGGKWPGDDEHDRSMKYFRKYVKPILVAAAVDYNMVKGKRLGDIANHIADEIKSRRRLAAGIDELRVVMPNTPSQEAARAHELAGGVVLVGRPTFKEFMHGLHRGWTESMERVDREEHISRELANDSYFDEPDLEPSLSDTLVGDDGEPLPTRSRLSSGSMSNVYSPLKMPGVTSTPLPATPPSSIPGYLDAVPSSIPPQPPLLLVQFTNYVGLRLIPLMIWDFFHERHKVLAGAKDGYRLVMDHTRPFIAPPPSLNSPDALLSTSDAFDARPQHDLDFSVDAEWYYKPSLQKIPTEIEKARTEYYAALPERLATARALARGEREPTKDEVHAPPPTEVELRAERVQKEMRWRADLAGWEIVKPQTPVVWDERMRGALRVFEERPDGSL